MSSGVPPVHQTPWWLHVLGVAWIIAMPAFARVAPDAYYDAMQEDRATEWATAALFVAAAIVGGAQAWRRRRIGDGLVALFCLAAAGEEISWGQRLIGYTPSGAFLANNAQQEANLHNLVEAFGQPKWSLIVVLATFGVLAPLLVRAFAPLRHAADRLRFTPPPLALVPGYAVVIIVLIAYPVCFTGEWAETLAGLLFLASTGPRVGLLLPMIVTCIAFAGAMQACTARARRPDPSTIACAHAEVEALASALANDAQFARRRRMHRRIWSAIGNRATLAPVSAALHAVPCTTESAQPERRRRYIVDPWGTAYWVRVMGAPGARLITVHSFGPNRRRDQGMARGDDIASRPMWLR